MKKRAAIVVRAIAAFTPVVMVGAGVGAGFGWPLGLIAAGGLLWIEDTALLRRAARSGEGT